MPKSRTSKYRALRTAAALCATAPLLLAGCKTRQPPPDDAALTSSVNRGISQDGAVNTQPIQASVQGGVATLTGSVSNDAQKTIAARDAQSVAGVTRVDNELAVVAPGAVSATVAAAPPQPIPVPAPAPVPAPERRLPLRPEVPPQVARQRPPAPIDRAPAFQAPQNQPQAPIANVPPPPPPPPKPAFRDVTLPVGTAVPVRINQGLDSATTQQGDNFSGTVTQDVLSGGLVAIPAGTAVSGNVDQVQEAAHFKGNSLLSIALTGVREHGERISITTEDYSVKGKGRGTNTAEKTGGGAAVGAILGGIFGGGRGAAIGAGAGAGVGAGANAITRGEQVQIPSESVVRFHLSSPLTLHVRTDALPRGGSNTDGGLQPRPAQSY